MFKKILVLMPLLLLVVSCGDKKETAGGVTEIKLAHTLPQSHPIHEAYNRFAELVAENTKGKYNVIVYADALLGDQRSTIQLAQSGGLELVHMNVAILEGFDPIFTLLNLPYIFKDYDHFTRVMTDPKIRDMYALLKPKKFMPITYLEGGARSFYVKTRAINTPADLKGLKIRVQESVAHIEMIKKLGGSAVAMVPSEIYTALQQGVIDGAENNSPTFVSQKHSEVAKFYSLSEHMRLSDILSVGVPFWDGLTEEEQGQFLASAAQMTEEFADVWAKGEKAADAELKALDVKFNTVNQEEFRNLVLPMHEAYGAENAENKKWLDWIRSLE